MATVMLSASSLDEMYVGSGSRNVSKVFKLARKFSPCLIIIDEFDSIAAKRSEDQQGLSSTLN